MRSILTSSLLLFPLVLACGDKDDSGGGDGGSDGGGDGGSDGGGGDGGAAPGAVLRGNVVMADGSPAAVQVRLCEELCRSESTDKAGAFEYTAVEPAHYALEAVYLTDQKHFGMPLDFITIAPDEVRELETAMIVYEFATVHDLTGGAELVELDGGLSVNADPAAMVPSLANSPYLADEDPDYVASVSVSPGALGLGLEDVQGEVAAAWFMGRASVVLDPPWSFSSTETLGLAEGESVRVLAADYDTKAWLDGGTATVTGGLLVSDLDSGIPALSTVLFVRE